MVKHHFARFSWSLMALASLGIVGCTGVAQMEHQHSPEHQQQMGMDHSDHGEHSMAAMELGPQDGNFDLLFIDAMILHHQGAIAMAEELQANSQRPEMQTLAEEIIVAQNQEIAQMQTWRQQWYPEAPSEPLTYDSSTDQILPMDGDTQQAMRMDMDLGPGDTEFDQRFIDAMVPHHEGAVVMAQQVLANPDSRPELRQLADQIISAQQQEIEQMRQWRQQWYGSAG